MGRKAVLAPRFEYKPSVPITGNHAKAHENLQEKLLYFRKRLEAFRSKITTLMNKDRQHYGFTVGQIVYITILVEASYKLAAEKFNVILLDPLQFTNV